MKIRETWKKVRSTLLREQAARKVRRLDLTQVMDWADQYAIGVSQAVEDYRRSGGIESLYEARHGTETLLGILDVAIERHELRKKIG